MRVGIVCLCASLALLAGSLPASADVVTLTYTGSVYSGTGNYASSPLIGDSYTATYIFDTSLGSTSSSSTVNQLVGGLVSANINIGNGALVVTDTTISPNLTEIVTSNNGTTSSQESAVQFSNSTAINGFLSEISSPTTNLPLSITTPFTYTPTMNDNALTELYFQTVNNGACVTCSVLNGTITSVTESATPLPAALPLFATGLSGLGLLGWRRKRKAQAV